MNSRRENGGGFSVRSDGKEEGKARGVARQVEKRRTAGKGLM